MATASTAPGLLRSLRRWDLVAVVINGVIGAGIFGLPSRIFALAGTFSLVSFAVCALCVSVIVFAFAEVASRYSSTGGPYLFAYDTYGPTAGFVVGWLVWMARITSFAANSSLLPEYLGFFFPALASGLPRAIILTGVVLLLTFLNVRGVRDTANTSNILAAGKLVPLGIFIAAGLFFLAPGSFSLSSPPNYHNFSQSVLLLVYAFTGFEMATIPGGESRNPKRDLPAALLMGMAVVVTVYILLQTVCMGTLPGLALSKRPLADAAARFMGQGGAAMITAGIVISLGGNLNVLILSASRILYAIAGKGGLPASMAAIHPRYRTPAISVVFTTAVMLALALSGTFIYLVTLSTIARLVTYLATCGALPILRRRPDAPPASFLAPGGVWFGGAGVVVCVWLLSNTTWRELGDAALAVAVGLVIYGVCRSMRRAESTGSEGL